jgi:hypothetical protein
MPRCYFLLGRGETSSSADRHPVGRKSLTPSSRKGVASRPSERSDKWARASATNLSLRNVVVLKIGGSVLTGTKASHRPNTV